jgi:hypothetical protein
MGDPHARHEILCGSSVGVEEMGWISPWVLTVSKSTFSDDTSHVPVETKPVGGVVDSDFILFENCGKLER